MISFLLQSASACTELRSSRPINQKTTRNKTRLYAFICDFFVRFAMNCEKNWLIDLTWRTNNKRTNKMYVSTESTDTQPNETRKRKKNRYRNQNTTQGIAVSFLLLRSLVFASFWWLLIVFMSLVIFIMKDLLCLNTFIRLFAFFSFFLHWIDLMARFPFFLHLFIYLYILFAYFSILVPFLCSQAKKKNMR